MVSARHHHSTRSIVAKVCTTCWIPKAVPVTILNTMPENFPAADRDTEEFRLTFFYPEKAAWFLSSSKYEFSARDGLMFYVAGMGADGEGEWHLLQGLAQGA